MIATSLAEICLKQLVKIRNVGNYVSISLDVVTLLGEMATAILKVGIIILRQSLNGSRARSAALSTVEKKDQ